MLACVVNLLARRHDAHMHVVTLVLYDHGACPCRVNTIILALCRECYFTLLIMFILDCSNFNSQLFATYYETMITHIDLMQLQLPSATLVHVDQCP